MMVELRMQKEHVICTGLDSFFRIGSCQPVQPYTLLLANLFFYTVVSSGAVWLYVNDYSYMYQVFCVELFGRIEGRN